MSEPAPQKPEDNLQTKLRGAVKVVQNNWQSMTDAFTAATDATGYLRQELREAKKAHNEEADKYEAARKAHDKTIADLAAAKESLVARTAELESEKGESKFSPKLRGQMNRLKEAEQSLSLAVKESASKLALAESDVVRLTLNMETLERDLVQAKDARQAEIDNLVGWDATAQQAITDLDNLKVPEAASD